MKKYELKSLIKQRLIPMLLVPALLGSNVMSIQASADDSYIESNDEPGEGDTTPAPAPEEPNQDAPAEGGGSGSDQNNPTDNTTDNPGEGGGQEGGDAPAEGDDPSTGATDQPGSDAPAEGDSSQPASDASSEATSSAASEASSDGAGTDTSSDASSSASSDASSDSSSDASSDASSDSSSDAGSEASSGSSNDDAASDASSGEEDKKEYKTGDKVPVSVKVNLSLDGEAIIGNYIKLYMGGDKKDLDTNNQVFETQFVYSSEEEYTEVPCMLDYKEDEYKVDSILFNSEPVEMSGKSFTLKIKNESLKNYDNEQFGLEINVKALDNFKVVFSDESYQIEHVVDGNIAHKDTTDDSYYFTGDNFTLSVSAAVEVPETVTATCGDTTGDTPKLNVYYVVNGDSVHAAHVDDAYIFRVNDPGTYYVTDIYATVNNGHKRHHLDMLTGKKIVLKVVDSSEKKARVRADIGPKAKNGWVEGKVTLDYHAESYKKIETIEVNGTTYSVDSQWCGFGIIGHYNTDLHVEFADDAFTEGYDREITAIATFELLRYQQTPDVQKDTFKFNYDNSYPSFNGMSVEVFEADQGGWRSLGCLNELENKYNFSKTGYKILIKLPEKCDTGSGLTSMACSYAPGEDAKEVVRSGDGSFFYVEKELRGEDIESAFNLQNIVLTDEAGHSSECTGYADKYLVVDTKAPVVTPSFSEEKKDSGDAEIPEDSVDTDDEFTEEGDEGEGEGEKPEEKTSEYPDYYEFHDSPVTETITFTDYDFGFATPQGLSYGSFVGDSEIAFTPSNSAEALVFSESVVSQMGLGGNFDSATSDYERHVGFDCTYKFSDDGKYVLSLNVADKLGNNTTGKRTIVVDQTDPTVELEFYAGGKRITPSGVKDTVVKGPVTVKAIATEAWIVKKNSYLAVVPDGQEPNPENGSQEWNRIEGHGDRFECEVTVSEEGAYSVAAVVADMLNTPAVKTGPEYGFTIDNTPPKVDIQLENKNALNGKYYNAKQTAVITVTEKNFDEDLVEYTFEDKYGKHVEGAWSHNGEIHTLRVDYPDDGIYSLSCSCVDKAKNGPGFAEQSEFVVDKKAPVIKVTIAGGTPRNEIYYKDQRYANIQIEDLSFSADLVEYTSQELGEDGVKAPMGSFSGSELTYTAGIRFDKDGKYGFVIGCKDLAGNSCEEYVSDIFVIDTKAPEVKFAGVENFSANNGTVAPVVTYTDKYMDMEQTTVTMLGSNNGAVTLDSTSKAVKDGFVVTYTDFPREKAMDDLYTMETKVVDLAGNETKEELVFSVNRFGSVFVLSNATKALNEQYYTKEAQDVVITEINVDELTYRDVSINRDGDIKELKRGIGYKVAKQGTDVTWKTYTYTIPAKAFKKDGVYSVTVYTRDRATNEQDNKSRDAEINFAKDSAAPSIVTAGIKAGEVYREDKHSFNIDVTDNLGINSLVVYKNDEVIGEYTTEDLDNDFGTETITLEEDDNAMTITIVAEDFAGNVETVEYKDVYVTTKLPEVEGAVREQQATETTEGGNTKTVSGGTIDNHEDRHRRIMIFVWGVAILGAVGLIGGTGVFLYKKKENE